MLGPWSSVRLLSTFGLPRSTTWGAVHAPATVAFAYMTEVDPGAPSGSSSQVA
jgi:hypothetical protein